MIAPARETLSADATPLSPDERNRLRELILTVNCNLSSFLECGRALLESHPWSSLDPDKTPLMKDGGGGYKIQFDLALMARSFLDRRG